MHVRLERREVAGLAAAHVVRHAVGREEVLVLGDVLEAADRRDNLQLGAERDRVPHLRRAQPGGHHALRPREREGDPRVVHHEADEAGHRDAAVLDLGVAQEADRGLGALAPEVLVGEADRVPEADHRVLRLRERLEVGLAEAHLRRRRSSTPTDAAERPAAGAYATVVEEDGEHWSAGGKERVSRTFGSAGDAEGWCRGGENASAESSRRVRSHVVSRIAFGKRSW